MEIEERLKKELNSPVFHDDQHGTAIVVLAGVLNTLKAAKKEISHVKIVVNGAGSAGIAITKLLLKAGFDHIIVVDKLDILAQGEAWMNWAQEDLAKQTNKEGQTGTLKDALRDTDVFIGVSAPNIVTSEMVKSMNKDAIIFAMANPVP